MKANTTIVPNPEQNARIRRRLKRVNLNEVYGVIPTPPGVGTNPHKSLTLALRHLQKEMLINVKGVVDETVSQLDK